MTERIFNFSAGPCTLPLPALEKAQAEFLNYQNTGMSIIEHSHRGKSYDDVHNQAIANLRKLLNVPEEFDILMMHGGATLQFAMIPLNFTHPGKSADYVLTGAWANKAAVDGKKYPHFNVLWSNEDENFTRMPNADEIKPGPYASYVHLCSNETIGGIELQEFPDCGDIPVIMDMSSHIMSRPLPWEKLSMVYAGAQKNLGPAGMAVVFIRKSMVETCNTGFTSYLSYKTQADKNSLYNTPPVFAVYMMNLVLEWVADNGGVDGMSKLADQRSQIVYKAIDESEGWYSSPVPKNSRSRMNVVWRLPTVELEQKFISEALAAGMAGLKGHRSVGGCRASMYNAMPVAGAEALANFMRDFQKKNS